MTVKELREFVFRNYYKQINFTRKDCYCFSKKLRKPFFFVTCYQLNKISGPTKAIEQNKLILKSEGKKIHKVSKTVKNSGIRSVTVKHPKTAFNLLKTKTQSNIITQKLGTIEKLNIFEKESVTIEYQKTVTVTNYQSS